MSNFKVGDKARFVRNTREPPVLAAALGEEVVVVQTPLCLSDGETWDCLVAFRRGGSIPAMFSELEPATDPYADAFLESIRKLKPYEEPKVREYDINGVRWTVTDPPGAVNR